MFVIIWMDNMTKFLVTRTSIIQYGQKSRCRVVGITLQFTSGYVKYRDPTNNVHVHNVEGSQDKYFR
jgi:hypothetical protein